MGTNFGLLDILGVGLAALLAAVAVLLPLVRLELGPAGRLASGGRWLLALALGAGVLAFGFKLAVILLMGAAPELTIERLRQALSWAQPLQAEANGASEVTPPPRYVWQALPEVAPSPPGNPTTPEKVALGRRLFFDTALSADRSVACASCHDVGGNGTDSRRTALGIGGRIGGRNSPTVWNAGFQAVLFWDGRAASLEEQAKGPPINPIEMGMPSLQAVAERVRGEPGYKDAFAAAFGAGRPITIDRIAEAIAAYERTLITPDAPYDRFVRGDRKALTPQQLRGMALFQSVGCIGCHSGPNFSGASLFETGSPRRTFPTFPSQLAERRNLGADRGGAAPGARQGIWRIPSLRNVGLTAPYFHNGSVDDLAEAVRIMANAQLGRRIGASTPASRDIVWSDGQRALGSVEAQTALSEADIADIVAFLRGLSSDRLVAAMARKP
jgi:cytochrome c peroxidase